MFFFEKKEEEQVSIGPFGLSSFPNPNRAAAHTQRPAHDPSEESVKRGSKQRSAAQSAGRRLSGRRRRG